MIRYMFRVPKFPVVCNINGYLIGARSDRSFQERMAAILPLPKGVFPVVDSTGRNWSFYTEHMIVSPLNFEKRWSKRRLIEMFNQSDNAKELGITYFERSLSAKRYDRIFGEIVDILDAPRKAK